MIFQHVQLVLVHPAVVNADSPQDSSRYSHFDVVILFESRFCSNLHVDSKEALAQLDIVATTARSASTSA